MVYLPKINFRRNKRQIVLFYSVILIILTLLQLTLLPLIVINESQPNILNLLAIWIVLREGKLIGFLAAFIIGIIFDILTLQVVGVGSFAFLVSALIASFFYRQGKEELVLGSYKFIFIVFISILASNLIQNIFYVRLTQVDFWLIFIFKWLGSTIYTTIISLIPYYITFKKRH
jgi:rod shape-determining protein MreD